MTITGSPKLAHQLLCVAVFTVALVAHAGNELPVIRPAQTILHPPIAPASTQVPVRIATDGITALVTDATERVVHVYRRHRSGAWNATQLLSVPGSFPPSGSWDPHVDVQGDLAVITDSSNASGPEAYVYRQTGGQWRHVQTLSDPAGTPPFFGAFGFALAIKRDAIVITDQAHDERGAVYIFKRARNGAFVLSQTIQGTSATERLGNAVAVRGATLLVGAIEANAAYVFEEVDGTWVQRQKLTPVRDETGFGERVALSNELLAVSADSRESMPREGSVYVYVPRGPQWKRQQILESPDGPGGLFASTIEVHGSQLLTRTISFGAEFEPWISRIHLFERSHGSWRPTALLIGNEGDPTNNWGDAIAAGRGVVFTATLADPAPPDGAPPVLGRTHILKLP